jgi:hypothetical protein
MFGRDDPCFAGVPISAPGPAPEGGEPWRSSCKTSFTIRLPGCRESVANLFWIPSGNSSPPGWSAGGIPGGAVPPLAFAQWCRAMGSAKALLTTPARSVQLVRSERSSRLCVLMNPCPAGLAIHRDLAGEILQNNLALAGRTLTANAREPLANPFNSRTGACGHSSPHPAPGT